MNGPPFLELRGLCKSFGDTVVLEDLSLEVAQGEILTLLGLSGSGKTTALRLLAGFERPDTGSVIVAGEDVTRLGPVERGFGMVFQHYALFPHLSVAQNVGFGLEARRWSRRRIDRRVAEMLTLVDLAGFGQRRVSAISGGQQQRVALARALAPEPRLLLLDEPLSNLDPALRERTRSELRDAVQRIGITTVLVTHEQEEAFHVGDRVAVLNAGRLEQLGLAPELYRRPATRFVAGFVGRSSALSGVLRESCEANDEVAVEIGGPARSGPDAVSWTAVAGQHLPARAQVELVVRPEALRLQESDQPGGLGGRIAEIRFTGALTYAVVEIPGLEGAEVEVLVDGPDEQLGREVKVVRRNSGPVPRVFGRELA